MNTEVKPIGYSINDAIAVSSIKRTKLYQLISAGTLETVLVGKRRIVKADSLHRLIEAGA